MWQTWWSILSDHWLMSKASTDLCKRHWASAGLVSCFHVPSAYSGHCSTKATRPLPPTLKTLPTPGAAISPREEINPTGWFIQQLWDIRAQLFSTRRRSACEKWLHVCSVTCLREGPQKVYDNHVFVQQEAVVWRVTHCWELSHLLNN